MSLSPVYLRDYGIRVTAEYRIGPEVVCEAIAIKCDGSWIIDGIETDKRYRHKGYAREVVKRIVEFSGFPVTAITIANEAQGFWKRMEDEELFKF